MKAYSERAVSLLDLAKKQTITGTVEYIQDSVGVIYNSTMQVNRTRSLDTFRNPTVLSELRSIARN